MAETIKICGLSTAETVSAALRAGADMVGFVFFAKSPRNVSYETARALSRIARGGGEIVALCVDATDATLNEIVAACEPDYLQLHGSEDPERVAAIQRKFGVSANKAIGVAVAADLAKADAYKGKSDALLIDAKPPKGGALPGGNGMPFDWRLAANFHPRKPWLLSGGLDADNVATAIRLTGTRAVDVSSGVESAPGLKDIGKIKAFVEAARAAFESEG